MPYACTVQALSAAVISRLEAVYKQKKFIPYQQHLVDMPDISCHDRFLGAPPRIGQTPSRPGMGRRTPSDRRTAVQTGVSSDMRGGSEGYTFAASKHNAQVQLAPLDRGWPSLSVCRQSLRTSLIPRSASIDVHVRTSLHRALYV